MGNKKDVHISGALASLLNSGDISTIQNTQRNNAETEQKPHINNYFPSIANTEASQESVLTVDPNEIKNWEHHDRPDNEVGDIESLAQEFITIGQQQPCVVRKTNPKDPFKYEIIAGQRRWLAAKQAKIKLKVLVKDLDDHDAALCQAGENSQRKDLSDYAKGINYGKLIKNKILSRQELQDKLKISKSTVRNLLSFEKIDADIWEAIGDYSKISAATAYEMSRLLSSTAADYRDALLSIAPMLSGKNISDKKLRMLIDKYFSKKSKSLASATEIKTSNGRHIFTWRKDSNGNRSIAFPKDIREIINFELLSENLKSFIEEQLNTKPDH